jgi:hypothetical protein
MGYKNNASLQKLTETRNMKVFSERKSYRTHLKVGGIIESLRNHPFGIRSSYTWQPVDNSDQFTMRGVH